MLQNNETKEAEFSPPLISYRKKPFRSGLPPSDEGGVSEADGGRDTPAQPVRIIRRFL